MKIKLPAIHPKVAAAKTKHTAAILTITGGTVHFIPLLAQYEAVLFAAAGCLAIYMEDIVAVFHASDE